MTDHPNKIAARMSYSPKLAARATGITQAEVRAIREKQSARYAIKRRRDPLIDAAATRRFRTPSAIAAFEAEQMVRIAAIKSDIESDKRRRERDEAIRRSLMLAARAARKLGFKVRASSGRNRTVSSYYCHCDKGSLRISDHDIPSTPQREFMAREHGRDTYNGYHGAQLIIDQPRRYEWLKRAIILAAAGRM